MTVNQGFSVRIWAKQFRFNNFKTDAANTDIAAVFSLILQTAVNKNMTQDELPQNILILSDMEFDYCVGCSDGSRCGVDRPTKRLFEVFAEKYVKHGYKLPRLVFWNICSRTGTIPVKENDLGVSLVSGFSPTIAKMVLSNSLDPLDCLNRLILKDMEQSKKQ